MNALSRHVSELVFDNPMLIEIQRFRRKYWTLRGSGFAGTLLILIGIFVLIMVQARYPAGMPTIGVLYIQTTVFCFLGPALLHASIAGERERRSWDFLLVAPVSRAQVVFGKFFGAVWGLGVVSAIFLAPLGIARLAESDSPYRFDIDRHLSPYDLTLQFLVVTTFGLLVCAATLFFSARCRRPLMALGAVLGLLLTGLIAVPLLIAPFWSGGGSENVLYFHPYVVIAMIDRTQFGGYGDLQMWGVPQILVYLGLSLIFLIWTVRTVSFADNEVKFVNRRSPHA